MVLVFQSGLFRDAASFPVVATLFGDAPVLRLSAPSENDDDGRVATLFGDAPVLRSR